MTYPGLVLLVGVGVGLATFLYYMFAENNSENEQQCNYNNRNRTSSFEYDDWGTSSASSLPRSENGNLNRRKNTLNSSSRKKNEAKKYSINKEEIMYCSICQYPVNPVNCSQLLPCEHNFHEDCINTLRSHDPMAPCPNCRRKFTHIK